MQAKLFNQMKGRTISIIVSTLCLALLMISAGAAFAQHSAKWEFGIDSQQSNMIYLPITSHNFPFRVGYVTDPSGIDGNEFNKTNWEGVERAMDELGVAGGYLESSDISQYDQNLRLLASLDFDLIIAPGFTFNEALAEVAPDYPNNMFTIVDWSYPTPTAGRPCCQAPSLTGPPCLGC